MFKTAFLRRSVPLKTILPLLVILICGLVSAGLLIYNYGKEKPSSSDGVKFDTGCPVPDDFCNQGVIEGGYIVFDLPEGTPLLATFDGRANFFESGKLPGVYLTNQVMEVSYYTKGTVYVGQSQQPVTRGRVLGTSGLPVPGTPADHSLFLEVRIDGKMVYEMDELRGLFDWLR